MKDYTKYDFPLIFNSSVYIEYTNIEGKKDCMSGTLLTQTQNEICIQDDFDHKSFWAIEKKTILSLTAKIKVEDMSVKQLKKAFNLGTYEVLVFNEATGTIANRDVDGGELGHTYEELPFNDYIDCTDWGRKHE